MAVETPPEAPAAPDLPFSLAIISERLTDVRAPEEPFDPHSEWENRYTMWIALRGSAGKSWDAGALRIRCKPTKTTVDLSIMQLSRLLGTTNVALTRAEMECAADKLTTPRKWTVRSGVFSAEGKPIDYTQVRVSGESRDRAIILRGESQQKVSISRTFTSDWSLFHALCGLHRLSSPASEERPVEFDLLEDLELPKPGQRLWYKQSVEVELGGKTARLHGWEQIGRGILPYTYWLDASGRVLLALGGLRTFIWNPDAELPEVEI